MGGAFLPSRKMDGPAAASAFLAGTAKRPMIGASGGSGCAARLGTGGALEKAPGSPSIGWLALEPVENLGICGV